MKSGYFKVRVSLSRRRSLYFFFFFKKTFNKKFKEVFFRNSFRKEMDSFSIKSPAGPTWNHKQPHPILAHEHKALLPRPLSQNKGCT